MEDISIRQAGLDDYDAICMLFEQVDLLHANALPELFQPGVGPARSQEWFAQISASKEDALFVAEQRGVLVGLILCQVRYSPAFELFVPRRYAHVNDIVVRESSQGQGIGQMLLRRVHEWAKEQSMTEIDLDVYEFNTSARLFYERLGYQTMRRTMWLRSL